MVQIHVSTSTNTKEELADLLRHIASQIDEGYTSGYTPHWTITGEEEKTDND
jgi:hypothetical protein